MKGAVKIAKQGQGHRRQDRGEKVADHAGDTLAEGHHRACIHGSATAPAPVSAAEQGARRSGAPRDARPFSAARVVKSARTETGDRVVFVFFFHSSLCGHSALLAFGLLPCVWLPFLWLPFLWLSFLSWLSWPCCALSRTSQPPGTNYQTAPRHSSWDGAGHGQRRSNGERTKKEDQPPASVQDPGHGPATTYSRDPPTSETGQSVYRARKQGHRQAVPWTAPTR